MSSASEDRFGAAEVDHVYSPSQIDSFIGCQRKWVFKSLLRMYTEQAKSAALGDAVHAELERYYKGGDIEFTSEAGYIAEAALKHLPPPGELIKPERKWGLFWKGHHFTGRADLTDLRRRGEGFVTVIDHKTTKDLKWSKTEEALRTDPQAMLYALEGMGQFQVPKIELFWNYVTTKKPYTPSPVKLFVSSEHVVEQCNKMLEEQIIPMDALVRQFKLKKGLVATDDDATRVLSHVPPNIECCDAFGGCPYKSRCKDLGASKRIGALMNQKVADLIAKRKAANAAATGNIVEEKEAPKQEPEEKEEAAPPSEKPEASTPKKPGRPVGAKNKPKEPVLVTPKTLYVGCTPVKGGGDTILKTIELVNAAHDSLKAAMDVPDFRFVDYGKGKGALVAEIRAAFDTGEYGTSFTSSALGQDVGNILVEALSDRVDVIVM